MSAKELKEEGAKKSDPSSVKKGSSVERVPLVNPVLVTVGNPALPHQTAVYAW